MKEVQAVLTSLCKDDYLAFVLFKIYSIIQINGKFFLLKTV